MALLSDPRSYPEKPPRIRTVETHMSYVFLTPAHAYKLKKPVRYDFLDFSTLASREWNCREEVRLNRPLAPGVYLAVVPLAVKAGQARLESDGAPADWLVKMRRLPAGRMLHNVITAGRLRESDIRRLADVLVSFYRAAPPVVMGGAAYRAGFERMIARNREALSAPRYALPAGVVARVHDALSDRLATAPQMFDRRAQDGRIVEGHGDLRPEHVCLEAARPIVFDRLEFNRAFRLLDPVEELGFLSMECRRLGEPAVGRILLGAYRALTGDRPPAALVRFYKAHRACIRARLAVLHTAELERARWPRWLRKGGEYLRLAEDYCRGL